MASRPVSWHVQRGGATRKWDYIDEYREEHAAGSDDSIDIWALQELPMNHKEIGFCIRAARCGTPHGCTTEYEERPHDRSHEESRQVRTSS